MKLKSSKPRSVKTLRSTISDGIFRKALADTDVSKVLEELRKSGRVIVQGTKVAYQLPGS